MFTPNSIIKLKGFDLSIGTTISHIALFSHSTGEVVKFTSIKKGGRLAKIKRILKRKLSSSEEFFFEGMSSDDTNQIIKILK